MPSVNDEIKDKSLEHSISLLRVEAGLKADVKNRLDELMKILTSTLTGASMWDAKRKQTIQHRLNLFLKESKDYIDTAYLDISKEQYTALLGIAIVSEKQAVDAINSALKIEYSHNSISKAMFNKIVSDTLIEGAPSSEWWQRRSTAFQGKFKDIIRQGMSRGEGIQSITKTLIGTKANNYHDSAFKPNYRSAEALVRTSVQSVANQAKLIMYNNNADIIKSIAWSSTLDSRTTNICIALDGLQWRIIDYKPIGHDKKFPGPTAHWNERSTQIPVTKSAKELGLSKKFDKIPESTRASMDGQVSAKLDYEKWLKTKDKAFQIDVLGPKRHKLWVNGKLEFTDMIDQAGNTLTLKQLNDRL